MGAVWNDFGIIFISSSNNPYETLSYIWNINNNNRMLDLEHAHFLLHYILPSQESKVEQSGDLASIIAPELREINPLTPDAWTTAGDVYSFGDFLWEIHETSIHQGEHDEGIIIVPQDCPWRSIILQCWNQEPALRPTLNQVLDQLSEIRLSLRVVLGCNC
jgi:hypothetical protein